MVARTLAELGTIDALVNNAGILIAATVETLPEDAWDAVMDVNAKGVFLVTQAVLPAMKAQGYGRICTIASIGGKHGAPEQAHLLGVEGRGDGLHPRPRPGGRPLRHHRQLRLPGHHPHRHGSRKPRRSRHSLGLAGEDRPRPHRRPRGRRRPRSAFFCSDDSAFVTGQSLNVDGGIVLS
jgi:3-oxoacyl-[acyl-carrier protein] reductase